MYKYVRGKKLSILLSVHAFMNFGFGFAGQKDRTLQIIQIESILLLKPHAITIAKPCFDSCSPAEVISE